MSKLVLKEIREELIQDGIQGLCVGVRGALRLCFQPEERTGLGNFLLL